GDKGLERLREAQQPDLYSSARSDSISASLLTGGMKKREREEQLRGIERGEIDIVVGTHALLQHDVRFHNLGLAVIDEQHKFGVMQRATLKAKGYNPDVLIMTATPIPRTLSLTMYGDLDVSILDELPPGRTPVITQRFYEKTRERTYRRIQRELESGRQAYIVYPLVEESENLDLKAATEMSRHLAQDIFPQYDVGLVHGRMKGAEKEEQMQAFKERKLHILVSTTVLEVGIDVPNATVMLIEHAERFGLSQLHQLRGRVGRGAKQSYCLLMTSYPMSNEARQRLDAMIESSDGFVIAERDLEIRGPGEFFGTKQSGLPDLNVANLIRDIQLLEDAREEAFAIIQQDPGLALPQHRPVKNALEQRWKKSLDLISIG
ncbi:MAG: ATP-dependent DNA helicase RecG, partial [bacterium]|nr:ATP-dependent DNA helicase RecG [bacterium]